MGDSHPPFRRRGGDRGASPPPPLRLADEEDEELEAADDAIESAAGVGILGDRLLIRDRGGIVPVALAQVERFQADDDYVAVYTRRRRYLMATKIGDLAARLPPDRFLRIHRSHIVNLDYVERLVPFDSKRLEVQLSDGTRLLASRASSELIRRRAR